MTPLHSYYYYVVRELLVCCKKDKNENHIINPFPFINPLSPKTVSLFLYFFQRQNTIIYHHHIIDGEGGEDTEGESQEGTKTSQKKE